MLPTALASLARLPSDAFFRQDFFLAAASEPPDDSVGEEIFGDDASSQTPLESRTNMKNNIKPSTLAATTTTGSAIYLQSNMSNNLRSVKGG